MSGYTLITQQQYSHLLKSNLECLTQKNLLQQSNIALREEFQFLKGQLKIFKHQIRAEKSQNFLLLAHLRLQSQKLHQSHKNLTKSTEAIAELRSHLDETLLKIQFNQHQKTTFQKQNILLSQRLSELQRRMSTISQETLQLRENRKRLQCDIRQLKNRRKEEELQYEGLLKQYNLKLENQKFLNELFNQQTQQLQNIIHEHDQTKQQVERTKHQIQLLKQQVQKYKQSSIQLLQKQLVTKETWIAELTTTIQKLKQRCIELEMISHPNHPNRHYVTPNKKFDFFINQRPNQQQQYRIKYLTICKNLAKKFTTKLLKINNEKKSFQQKYQNARLKLNQYQYNEFRYKDRINLYLQKIERFQKLAIKQQQQMQKIISQFDYELDNILKKKQHEVQMKFQQEIEKYRLELEKIKENHQDKIQLQQVLRDQFKQKDHHNDDDSEINNCDEKDQNGLQFIFHQIQNANNLNQQKQTNLSLSPLQMEKLKTQFYQKCQLYQKLNKQNRSLKKQIDKIQHSKNKYQQKFLLSEEECYQKFTQLRRYKTLVQELYRQLETKTNELEILNKQCMKLSGAQSCSPSNTQHNKEDISSFSIRARLSSTENNQNQNRLQTPKQHNTSLYEYQVSQIDTEGQLNNLKMLDNLIVGKMGFSDNALRKKNNQQCMEGIQIGRNLQKMQKINQGHRHHTNFEVNQALSSSSTKTIQLSSCSGSSPTPYTTSPNSSSYSSSNNNSYHSLSIKNLYFNNLIHNNKIPLLHPNTPH